MSLNISDLAEVEELDRQAMQTIIGGASYVLPDLQQYPSGFFRDAVQLPSQSLFAFAGASALLQPNTPFLD